MDEQLLLNKLDLILSSQVALDKKLELHIQKTEYELSKIHALDIEQNEQLRIHIQGVQTLKALLDTLREDTDKKFQQLEEPRKALKLLVKWTTIAGAVATAALALYKLFELM